MKKLIAIVLALMLTLTGCAPAARLPAYMSDGTPWDHSWTGLGGRNGVEQPGRVSIRARTMAISFFMGSLLPSGFQRASRLRRKNWSGRRPKGRAGQRIDWP